MRGDHEGATAPAFLRHARWVGRSTLIFQEENQFGGGDGDRTHYLLHAMQALYQLSYAPEGIAHVTSLATLGSVASTRMADDETAETPLHRGARERDRAPMAGPLGVRARVLDAEPRPGSSPKTRAASPTGRTLRARHVPVPERHRTARRPPARLHRHRRVRALPAHERLQRPARDGLRRVRLARRAVRGADRHAPARHDRSRTSRR